MKIISAIALTISLGASSLAAAQTAMPAANPNAPQNSAVKAPHDMKAGAPAAGHNSFTKGQAKGRIEKAGYTGVSGLMKDKDGLWQGHAKKDGHRVNVALDFEGNVTSK